MSEWGRLQDVLHDEFDRQGIKGVDVNALIECIVNVRDFFPGLLAGRAVPPADPRQRLQGASTRRLARLEKERVMGEKRGLLKEDHTPIKLVDDKARSAWFRQADPWSVDHRRTCGCGHRFNVHSKSTPNGGHCLAADSPPGQVTGTGCQCSGWVPV